MGRSLRPTYVAGECFEPSPTPRSSTGEDANPAALLHCSHLSSNIVPFPQDPAARRSYIEPLVEPLTGYNNHQTFYTKSVVARKAERLSKVALMSYFQYIIDMGLTAAYPWNTFISLFGGKDSQINAPVADSAAYSHRDSL
jgi:hypothetical protein